MAASKETLEAAGPENGEPPIYFFDSDIVDIFYGHMMRASMKCFESAVNPFVKHHMMVSFPERYAEERHSGRSFTFTTMFLYVVCVM